MIDRCSQKGCKRAAVPGMLTSLCAEHRARLIERHRR